MSSLLAAATRAAARAAGGAGPRGWRGAALAHTSATSEELAAAAAKWEARAAKELKGKPLESLSSVSPEARGGRRRRLLRTAVRAERLPVFGAARLTASPTLFLFTLDRASA
jgi:hypothetical protein